MSFKDTEPSQENIYEYDAYQTLSKIKDVLEVNLDIEIKDNEDIIDLLNNPEIFLDDKKVIKDINNLNDLIKLIGEYYYE